MNCDFSGAKVSSFKVPSMDQLYISTKTVAIHHTCFIFHYVNHILVPFESNIYSHFSTDIIQGMGM